MALRRENQHILSNLAKNGLDLSREVEIEFECQFSTKSKAVAARTKMRSLGSLPAEGLYMIAHRTSGKDLCSLLVCVPMIPDVQLISELEARLRFVGDLCGGNVSGWEFPEA
ncbi:Regulator of ribonuclease activity B [Yoonia rosea]|uniref:Regulator of ribonuclease activity B n=1 Tax=Yoonia rosea TaxID=287098 RepID=A0A1R3X2T2_9RHOB|nr:Regulator of ribonuclease activity B [Yoonia rosea]